MNTFLHNYTKPTEIKYTKLFINGEFVDGKHKQTIDVIDPADESLICKIARAEQVDVEAAIDAAHKAFPIWQQVPMRDRCQMLLKLADEINKHLKEFVELESLDNGKPLAQAQSDILEVINNIRYFAGWADKITGKTYTQPGPNLFYTRREPFGVVGLISPWNFPLLMCEWKFGPALAAGNCVVHKPSEVTPLTILRMAQCVKDAGFPPGVFNIVPGYGHDAGAALTSSKRISKISFTGSTLIGREVMKQSANSNLKKVCLELGGKSPVIIAPDADPKQAANLATCCIQYNMGQCCIAGSRLFIHDSVYDKVCGEIKNELIQLQIGSAFEKGTTHGPQVNKFQYDKICGYLEQAKTEKLELLFGGDPKPKPKGYFIQPTVYKNVPDNSRLAQEEIFGPVLCIMKPWKTIDEVIERANNTTYGLAGVVITKDMNFAEKCVREVQAGTIFVNTYMIPQSFIPFGGFKESGFGRDNAEEAINEYTHVKSVYYKLQEPELKLQEGSKK